MNRKRHHVRSALASLHGRALAHYLIAAVIGVGGMGEAYPATDTKLGCDVAIKVLLAEMASDPERLSASGTSGSPTSEARNGVLESGSGARGPLGRNIQQQRTRPTPVGGMIVNVLSLALIGNASAQKVLGTREPTPEAFSIRPHAFLVHPPSMKNRVPRASCREMGQSVIQAYVVGDCLKVGSLCDDTDPADKTDPRR